MRRRIEAIIVVVAAVIVFAIAGYVVVHQDPVRQAGATPGYSAGPSVTTSPVGTTSSDAASGSSSRKNSAKPVVTFLGDDYTAAVGASTAAKGFAAVLAARFGVTRHTVASAMSGYAKAGPDGRTYADRVADVVATHPDVVVVTGGRNDATDYQQTMTRAVAAVFAALHKALPQAVLVGVAPFWGDSDTPPELRPVTDAVRAGVTAAGGTYLAIPDPLHGHPEWMSDGADPNNQGYAAIAAALAPKIKPLLPTS